MLSCIVHYHIAVLLEYLSFWHFYQGGPPKLVLPATVPGGRIYRDGRLLGETLLWHQCVAWPLACDLRFWMQGPGPSFDTFDCSMIFHHSEPYQSWVQALVSSLLYDEVVAGSRFSVSPECGLR